MERESTLRWKKILHNQFKTGKISKKKYKKELDWISKNISKQI